MSVLEVAVPALEHGVQFHNDAAQTVSACAPGPGPDTIAYRFQTLACPESANAKNLAPRRSQREHSAKGFVSAQVNVIFVSLLPQFIAISNY